MSALPYTIETTETGDPIRPNTIEWLRRRRTGLGASDAPAVLGLSPWATPRDVFLDKTATVITDEQTEAMEFGHLMEPVAVELFRRRHGDPDSTRHRYLGKIEESPGLLRSVEAPHLLASLDSVIEEPDGQRVPGQIKNVTTYKRTAWAESEGGVPDLVRVQIIQEAIVTGVDHGYVLPIFGGNHMPEPIRVDVPDDFAEWYLDFSREWWETYPQAGIEPAPTLADDLSEIYSATMGASVDLDGDTLAALQSLIAVKAEIKSLEARRDELALIVKMFLGDATEGWDRTGPTPRLAVTWRQNKASAPIVELDEATLLRDHPELEDLLAAYRVEREARKAARPLLTK